MLERAAAETGPQAAAVLDQAAPSIPRRGAIVICICALLVISEGFCMPSIGLTAASLMSEMGLSRAEFGLSVTVLLTGFFVGTSTGGILGDRYGQKRTVLASFTAVMVAAALGAVGAGHAMLLISRAVMGWGLGAAFPTILAVAASQAPPEFRSRAIAIVTGAGAVGGVAAAVMVGIGGEAITWRTALWGLAVLTGVFLPFFAVFAPEHTSGGGGVRKPDARRILMGEGRLPMTVLLAAANFCVAFNMNGIGSWAPALLSARGISQQAIGLAAGFLGPCAMLANFGYATLFDRGYRRTAVAIAVLGAAPALVLFFLVSTTEGVIVAMGALGVTVVAGQLLLYAVVPACYPAEGAATAMGASMAASRLGAIVAPITLGILLEMSVPPWGLLGLMLPAVAVAILSTLFVLTKYATGARP